MTGSHLILINGHVSCLRTTSLIYITSLHASLMQFDELNLLLMGLREYFLGD
jgi:hypothetical protein